MGWERRRGRAYYYQKVREGNRIHSRYLGRGEDANRAAEAAEDRRIAALILRHAEVRTRARESAIDQAIVVAHAAMDALVEGTFCSRGYRRHSGQWRKAHKREKTRR